MYIRDNQPAAKPFVILERDFHSSFMLFGELHRLNGNLTGDLLHTYNVLHTVLNQPCTKPKLRIWIDTPVDTCYERTTRRQQSGDEAISLQYITELHAQHEIWFNTLPRSEVRRIDGTRSIRQIVSDVKHIIRHEL